MTLLDIQQWYLDEHHNSLILTFGEMRQCQTTLNGQYMVLMSYSDPFMVVDAQHKRLLAVNTACNRDDDIQCAMRFLDAHGLLQPNETWQQAGTRLTHQFDPYIFNRQSHPEQTM